MTERHQAETPEAHGDVRHEPRDVETRTVVRVIALVGLVTVATAGAAVVLLRALADRESRQFPPPPPVARQEPDRQPPEPRLQENPVIDVEQLRKEDHALLSGYEWVDKESGVVRIAIDRAMDLLVERGLPRVPARPVSAPVPASPEARR